MLITNEGLARLEAAGRRLNIPQALVDENRRQIRANRKADEGHPEFAWLRAAIRLSTGVLHIAEAHGTCYLPGCDVCPALKATIAIALAYGRDEKEQDEDIA
jgi:hypothetical protein